MSVDKKEFRFLSADKHTTCVGDIYVDRNIEPKYVLQIVHGMVEHFGRYEALANHLAQKGYVVVGIDHIGHGRSVNNHSDLGVYDHEHGAYHIVEDQHTLLNKVKDTYQGLPYIILGHSMGSFVTRCFIEKYSDEVDGAVIMGTAWQPKSALVGGRALTKFISLFHGWDYRSKLVDNAGCGSYNDDFEGSGAKTGYEWLSCNEDNCLAYYNDPLCGWMFSISGYYMISDLLLFAQDEANINRIRKDLPILVISGQDDPVGCGGDGPVKTFKAYRKAGLDKCELEIVENARHELLNETNWIETTDDICEWINTTVHR